MDQQQEEIDLELKRVEEEVDKLQLGESEPDRDEGGEDEPEQVITFSLTHAEVSQNLEAIRTFLRARGGGGAYAETELMLSRTVHAFTRETQRKRRATWNGEEVQATIGDMWRGRGV